MSTACRYFFGLWVLSLPFYSYPLVSSYSADNILSPIVLILLVVRALVPSATVLAGRVTATFVLFFLFGCYAAARLMSVVDSPIFFNISASIVAKQFLYFAIPLLFIRSLDEFRYAARLLIVIAVIGIFSALVASLGFYEFPVQRFAESRIGIETVQKAVGLFTNFGDMAMLGSFSLLHLYLNEKKSPSMQASLVKIIATTLILAGYIGAQSRNMLITLISGLVALAYFSATKRLSGAATLLSVLLVMLMGCAVVFGLSVIEVSSLEALRGLGGTREAAATVDARLIQYQYAWSLFAERPWFGHGEKVLATEIQVHNLWLGLMAWGGLASTVSVSGILLFIGISLIRTKPSDERQRLKIFALSQLIAIFVASEFYVSMSYVFLALLGAIATVAPIIQTPRARPVHGIYT